MVSLEVPNGAHSIKRCQSLRSDWHDPKNYFFLIVVSRVAASRVDPRPQDWIHLWAVEDGDGIHFYEACFVDQFWENMSMNVYGRFVSAQLSAVNQSDLENRWETNGPLRETNQFPTWYDADSQVWFHAEHMPVHSLRYQLDHRNAALLSLSMQGLLTAGGLTSARDILTHTSVKI